MNSDSIASETFWACRQETWLSIFANTDGLTKTHVRNFTWTHRTDNERRNLHISTGVVIINYLKQEI